MVNASKRRQDSPPGSSDSSSCSNVDSPPNPKKFRVNLKAEFVKGVSGVKPVEDQDKVWRLQQKCRRMCNFQGVGFPGTQPVSLGQSNIGFFHDKPYRVSWKADGTRYLMLIVGKDQVYMFDRDNNCFEVDSLKFPRREDLNTHLTDTLLDGEIVIDNVKGDYIPRFLIFDVICFNGEDVSQRGFHPDRGNVIEEIIKARAGAMARGGINRKREPFGIRMKSFWDISQTNSLLQPKFLRTLCHATDGLVFQPKFEPYMPGRSPCVLKWKPPSQNSVDFRLRIRSEGGTRKCLLFVTKHDGPFAEMIYNNAIEKLHNRIIECRLLGRHWVFMRERTDKSFPNSYSTVISILDSIRNPVTKTDLLDYINNHKFDSEF